MVLLLIPVGIIAAILHSLANVLDERSLSPFPWVWFSVGMVIVIVFLLMCLRIWFDMAELIAVADSETRSRKCLGRGSKVFWQNFGSLFWLYLRISLVGLSIVALCMHFWAHHIAHASIGKSLLVSQLIALFGLGTRFWHRASETIWYKNYLERPESEVMAPPLAPEPSLVESVR